MVEPWIAASIAVWLGSWSFNMWVVNHVFLHDRARRGWERPPWLKLYAECVLDPTNQFEERVGASSEEFFEVLASVWVDLVVKVRVIWSLFWSRCDCWRLKDITSDCAYSVPILALIGKHWDVSHQNGEKGVASKWVSKKPKGQNRNSNAHTGVRTRCLTKQPNSTPKKGKSKLYKPTTTF